MFDFLQEFGTFLRENMVMLAEILALETNANAFLYVFDVWKLRQANISSSSLILFITLEIRSVEHGICPIAEFTSP